MGEAGGSGSVNRSTVKTLVVRMRDAVIQQLQDTLQALLGLNTRYSELVFSLITFFYNSKTYLIVLCVNHGTNSSIAINLGGGSHNFHF